MTGSVPIVTNPTGQQSDRRGARSFAYPSDCIMRVVTT